MIKKKFNLEEVKKFLKKKGFVIQRKSSSGLLSKDLQSLYYTLIASFGIIVFFFPSSYFY